MPIVTQILCDGCKGTKHKTSQWFTMTMRQRTVEISRLDLQPDGRPSAERDGLQQYFCGSYCLLEAVTRWMDSLSKDPMTLPLPVFRSTERTLFVGDMTCDADAASEYGGPVGLTSRDAHSDRSGAAQDGQPPLLG